jgi:uncharacterized OB-fold protein
MKAFWDGAKERRLMLQYDPVAKRWQFYPRPVSLYGALNPLEWREAAGKGALVAHTTCHSPARGYEKDVPYTVGIVQLDEGPRIFSRIVNADPQEMRVGQRMRVVWNAQRFPLQFEPDR